MMRKAIAILTLLAVCLNVKAETNDSLSHWGGSFSVSPGIAISADKYQKKWLKGKHNLAFEAALSYRALPQDSDAFAADYGYPTFSAGVKYALNHKVTMHRSPDPAWGLAEVVDYDSHMGNTIAMYGTFARPLLRSKRWEADATMQVGVAYSHTKYDEANNIDNEMVGSRWLIYFGLGTHVTYRIAEQWGLKAGMEFWHMSNGALNRPNKGANFIAPSIGIAYMPYWDSTVWGKTGKYNPPFDKHLYLNLSLGVGAKTLFEEWNETQFHTPKGQPGYRTGKFGLYMAYSAQADLMYRYARRWASGIGVDVFYGASVSRVERMERKQGSTATYSPWSVGVGLKHQAFYNRWSLAMSLGWYLYRHMGVTAENVEKPYYERIGVLYSFPGKYGLTVGGLVKAHLTKADLTEFILAVPIRL